MEVVEWKSENAEQNRARYGIRILTDTTLLFHQTRTLLPLHSSRALLLTLCVDEGFPRLVGAFR